LIIKHKVNAPQNLLQATNFHNWNAFIVVLPLWEGQADKPETVLKWRCLCRSLRHKMSLTSRITFPHDNPFTVSYVSLCLIAFHSTVSMDVSFSARTCTEIGLHKESDILRILKLVSSSGRRLSEFRLSLLNSVC
jgi:hypothetical protein